MNVTAVTKNDYKAVKALVYASIFKKQNPKVFGVILVVLSIISLAETIALSIIDSGSDYHFILRMFTVILFAWTFMYFRLPKISYKQMGKTAESVNNFVFSDETISVTNEGNGSSGNSEHIYEAIDRVIETSKYFFIFINKSQAYIVSKEGITNGSVEDLRSLLSRVKGKKYIVSKY